MPKQQTVKLVLRLPPDLHRSLTKAARDQSPPVSLNHEMVTRLLRSFENEADIERMAKDIIRRLVTKEKRRFE
jgi:HicB family